MCMEPLRKCHVVPLCMAKPPIRNPDGWFSVSKKYFRPAVRFFNLSKKFEKPILLNAQGDYEEAPPATEASDRSNWAGTWL